jgi:dihydroorotase
VIAKLIERGHLDWPTALAKLTLNPARVLGLNKGTLKVGADADVVIIDPQLRWTVEPSQFRSKSGNTPLAGTELRGRAVKTIVGGEIRYDAPKAP